MESLTELLSGLIWPLVIIWIIYSAFKKDKKKLSTVGKALKVVQKKKKADKKYKPAGKDSIWTMLENTGKTAEKSGKPGKKGASGLKDVLATTVAKMETSELLKKKPADKTFAGTQTEEPMELKDIIAESVPAMGDMELHHIYAPEVEPIGDIEPHEDFFTQHEKSSNRRPKSCDQRRLTVSHVDEIRKAVIMSEILSKPKALQED